MSKMRKKGKVYPTPSSSTALFPASSGDFLTAFKLLPAAILTLVAVLSLEEREVLAYMITRPIKSTNNASFSSLKNKKKWLNTHKPPVFDCECFDCYTSYWFKWDSSPNRELIHQAIEAFEDHLNNDEQSRKKNKKRDKMGHHRLAGRAETPPPEVRVAQPSPEFEAEAPPLQAKDGDPDQVLEGEEIQPPEATVAAAAVVAAANQHKGLARTVLPDVLGLLNSRLWSLWSPYV